MELQHQPSIEIEPQAPVIRFTRRVRHERGIDVQGSGSIAESRILDQIFVVHPGNAGLNIFSVDSMLFEKVLRAHTCAPGWPASLEA
jgi:hypothetical protein